MVIATKLNQSTERKWGFPFGVDGVLNLKQASEMLGGISRSTVDRYAAAGKIRKGRTGKVVFCRRSILKFLETAEV